MLSLLFFFGTVVEISGSYVVVLPEECTLLSNGSSICVQSLDCPLTNQTFVRVIEEKDIIQTDTPSGSILYSVGTSIISCVDCATEVCAKINGSLPIILSKEANECVFEGGKHGEKVRIPLALHKSTGENNWKWEETPGNNTQLNYSHWAGNGKAPDIAVHAMRMCTTMGADKKWKATPCDMSIYHTQKDYLICSVPNKPDRSREKVEKPSQRSIESGTVTGKTSELSYIIAPLIILVVIAIIIYWRRNLDTENETDSSKNSIEIEQNENLQYTFSMDNQIHTTDSSGYLVPQQDSDQEESLYYEAGNNYDNTNQERDHSYYAYPEKILTNENLNLESDHEEDREYDLAFEGNVSEDEESISET